MIRDRLAELQAAQDEEDKDVCVAVEVTAEQASMDHFFVQIQEVLEETCKLEEAVSQVRKKHSEILSSSQSDPNLTRELDDLTAAIKRSGTRVNTKLKEIAPRLVEENEKHSADVRIRRTQHGGATRRFGEAMTLYYNVQEEYRDRCKDKIHRQMKITGKDPTEEELNEMLEKDNLEIFTQGIMMETQQANHSYRTSRTVTKRSSNWKTHYENYTTFLSTYQ
ncbi:Syntaxin-1A [Chionoecetes opilio]|nr:Syntaxin-1A [Chionoecetes opilio]